MTKNFPNLMKDIHPRNQGVRQSPGRINANHTWRHYSKTVENQRQKENLKAIRGKDISQISNKTVS